MNSNEPGSQDSSVPREVITDEGEVRYDDPGDLAAARSGRLSLGELTEAAGVSVRTVRYYIAEGLLPPPEGAGPGSAYTPGHLNRLRLIQRFKEDYLPLKEIRRRLSGLGDDEVRIMLGEEDQLQSSISPSASELPPDESLAGARDYLALMEARERYRTEPMSLHFSPPTTPGSVAAVQPEPSSGRKPARNRDLRDIGGGDDFGLPEREEAAAVPRSGLWRRIPLGDEAELVISDRVYARHRDRIDWLVRWARKVFA